MDAGLSLQGVLGVGGVGLRALSLCLGGLQATDKLREYVYDEVFRKVADAASRARAR